MRVARHVGPVAVAAALATAATAAKARDLVVDLTQPVVAVTTGFVGSSLLLYGVSRDEHDIVVIVRGPQRDEVVRQKERVAGIWVNGRQMIFDQVPAFYTVASNRPLGEVLRSDARAAYHIGLDHLDIRPKREQADISGLDAFRQALVRNKQRQGLYGTATGQVLLLGNGLFRSRIQFPANVAIGTYGIDVYAVTNGEIAAFETTLLSVRKFGIEAEVYDFAHRHAMAYGVLAILIAVMAGWLGSALFRKR